ncbi:hypothetical protein PISMIDRAFT_673771 [Pisolithus microcarpus 441]|uniref:Uncharacterized protein n=1 Tax=Pisolithus microcarpus 441 TaxID=765257 RepID=A0A0D0A0Z4_9AGAM|nr:hypothetical protein BKA83DRAFT_673771 [Pisolithus microcarpus]KIK28082.1 hypothetical protein PISMIDRAFT_673771 [Pisolithus microcarpus 441]
MYFWGDRVVQAAERLRAAYLVLRGAAGEAPKERDPSRVLIQQSMDGPFFEYGEFSNTSST